MSSELGAGTERIQSPRRRVGARVAQPRKLPAAKDGQPSGSRTTLAGSTRARGAISLRLTVNYCCSFGAMENPTLLVTRDTDRIVVHTHLPNTPTTVHGLTLEEQRAVCCGVRRVHAGSPQFYLARMAGQFKTTVIGVLGPLRRMRNR